MELYIYVRLIMDLINTEVALLSDISLVPGQPESDSNFKIAPHHITFSELRGNGPANDFPQFVTVNGESH